MSIVLAATDEEGSRIAIHQLAEALDSLVPLKEGLHALVLVQADIGQLRVGSLSLFLCRESPKYTFTSRTSHLPSLPQMDRA